MNRADVLQAAKEAVENRGNAYAPPESNFARIADLWSAILGVPVEPWEVALCQAAVKIARLAETEGRHPDSWIDLAGYAACGAEVTDHFCPACEAETATTEEIDATS